MSYELEFGPGPMDPNAIVSLVTEDLEAFTGYVERELLATQIFGAIVRKLSQGHSDEAHVETDVAGGKVGLEVAELIEDVPARLTDPDTPIVQQVYYPPVQLPDSNYALLSEVVHRRGGIDSEIVARIPWLYILPEEVLKDFEDGEVDYLSDVATETHYRSDLDKTGRTEGEVPFSAAQRVFFSHPLGQEAASEIERAKQELLEQQTLYLGRLNAIANIVLDKAPEDS